MPLPSRADQPLLFLAVALCLMTGCAYVGEPLPPALNVPRPVAAVAAEQVGHRVVMRFALPDKTTEDLPLQIGEVELRAGPVDAAVWPSDAARLPPAGSVDATPWVGKRILAGVRVRSKQGKWSAWSPLAALDVIAPLAAPAEVKVEAAPEGVRVAWRDPRRAGVVMRIERRRALGATEFVEGAVVEKGAEWIDHEARFGEEQQYRLTLVAGAAARSETVITPPLTPVDSFPPAVPQGLTAVTGIGAVELSWDRPADSDLAGFRVYRAPRGDGGGQWTRVSPAEPIAAASFSDRSVQRAAGYRYSVTSVDVNGNESTRSEAAEITAPE